MRVPQLVAFAAALSCAQTASAHHGFGRFEMGETVGYSGTLTSVDLVNPHSYMNFEAVGADGEVISMRCEMRAAVLLRRSGWSVEMFVPGVPVEIRGHPHRDDPHSCYLETFTLGDAPAISRNDQFSGRAPPEVPARVRRLESGELDLSGDWAVEQYVLTVPPTGGNGDLVPKSLRQAYASGEITLEQIRARYPGPPSPAYTAAGEMAAQAFRMWSPEDNPRLACKPTSIVFDWTFDWPVNRITQTTSDDGEQVIDIDYGLFSATRRIHLGLREHPSNLEPSNTGHSIGWWEEDTLVVDTIGFLPGVLRPPTRHSDRLHVVERFTLDTERMALVRVYVAEDPVYLAAPYAGSDTVFPSETPFMHHPCEELTYEFQPE